MWILYATLGSFFKALTSFFRKKISSKIDGDVYLWSTLLITTVVLFPFIILTNSEIPTMLSQYWLQLFIGAAATSSALIFNIAALKREELSYIAPLGAFIPIFALLFGWLFLGEQPPLFGVVGIILVFIGVYITNTNAQTTGWLGPIEHAITNTGARFAMGVAIAFAINITSLKSVTNGGFSAFEIMFMISIIGLLLTSYVPIKKLVKLKTVAKHHKKLLIYVSFASLIGATFALLAVKDTYVSYAISVRRLDIIFSILLGWRILKESNIRNKLIGSSLMLGGIVIIALA